MKALYFAALMTLSLSACATTPGFKDVANVIDVKTAYTTVQVPRQECGTERVAVQVYHQGEVRQDNSAGAMLGALVGGALGNTVGSGDGRQAATVIGAIIGYNVGNNSGNSG